MCVCCVEVLFKVYCSDHTYSTIRLPIAASVREVIGAVTDKLGSGDDLLLIHLNSAGGENTHTHTHTHTHTLSLAYALTCTHKQTHTHKSYFSILITIDSHFLCFHWCLINCRVINVCRVCCCTDSYLFDLWLTIWSLCCTRLAVAFHILHPSAAALWDRHSILTASYVCYRDWNELFHSPANLAATFLSYRPFIISTSQKKN